MESDTRSALSELWGKIAFEPEIRALCGKWNCIVQGVPGLGFKYLNIPAH